MTFFRRLTPYLFTLFIVGSCSSCLGGPPPGPWFPQASTTNPGVMEIATDAEAIAHTATDKALVPSNLDDVFASPPVLGGTSPSDGYFDSVTIREDAPTNTEVLILQNLNYDIGFYTEALDIIAQFKGAGGTTGGGKARFSKEQDFSSVAFESTQFDLQLLNAGSYGTVLHIGSAGQVLFYKDVNTTSYFKSTVATGTSPVQVTSTTLNTNLNADLWDGYQFADYLDQALKTTSSPYVSTFGIGVTPSYPLHIKKAVSDMAAGVRIRINNSDTSNLSEGDIIAGIEIGKESSDIAAYIRAVHTRTGTGHSYEDMGLVFGTSPSGNPAVAAAQLTLYGTDSAIGMKLHDGDFVMPDGHHIHISSDDSELGLYGASVYNQGARISLQGKDHATHPGSILYRTGGKDSTGYHRWYNVNTAGTVSGLMGLDYSKNLNLGSAAPTWPNGTNSMQVISGTAPTTGAEDAFQMYSQDIVAGNSAPHFRTEAGNTIKLYRQAAIVNADGTLADITTKFNTLLGYMRNLGLVTP